MKIILKILLKIKEIICDFFQPILYDLSDRLGIAYDEITEEDVEEIFQLIESYKEAYKNTEKSDECE